MASKRYSTEAPLEETATKRGMGRVEKVLLKASWESRKLREEVAGDLRTNFIPGERSEWEGAEAEEWRTSC